MQIDTVFSLSFNTRQTSMFIIYKVMFHQTLLTSGIKIPTNNHTYSRNFNNGGINPRFVVEYISHSM